MQVCKLLLAVLLASFAATAQSPVGISRFIDPWIDGWALQTNVSGDNEMATAWAANAMLPLFADPTGLPVLFPVNDSHLGGCSGGGSGLMIAQLSKLAGIGVTATTGNTLMTPINCMDSYQGSTAPNGTWSDGLSWKGAVMAFRNNRLLAYFYRQSNGGNTFTDSSLVMSPDAGQTWVDYGRYNGYTVTGTSCTSTTATLTVTNALSAGQKIYVHDVGTVYNGKQTIATASGSQVTYTVSTCTGASGSTGYFGILASDGSAPDGTGGAYNMMWPAASARQMVVPIPISYGQDGNYPTGIESACDPTAYVCGLSWDAFSSWAVHLWRVPLGQEMTKASYQWYYCPGYVPYWGSAETVCDGNKSASWTSTQASATIIFYSITQTGLEPQQPYMMKYLPSHHSYLVASVSHPPGYVSRLAYQWAPHPWGPFYPAGASECIERDANYPTGCTPFWALMDYGENTISTTPPLTQIRVSARSFGNPSEGDPGFWTIEAASGRVPFAGAARRADYMGISGQLGMGHRFVSGNEAGAISRRGAGYSLGWWTDLWEHGGIAAATARPYFRDLLSNGAKSFCPDTDNGAYGGCGFFNSFELDADGVRVWPGYTPRIVSSVSDSVFSASAGNASWTYAMEFKLTALGGGLLGLEQAWSYSPYLPLTLTLDTSRISAGDLCLGFGSDSHHTTFCTPGSTITTGAWHFLAISAQANVSGYPTIKMYLGTAGTITEFGGVNMAIAATGTAGANLTKTCLSDCTSTPAIPSVPIWVGNSTGVPYWNGGMTGTVGEVGLYSGVVPGHVIREIYRTLQKDWVRVGRGTL
jgi:hypothetical protein